MGSSTGLAAPITVFSLSFRLDSLSIQPECSHHAESVLASFVLSFAAILDSSLAGELFAVDLIMGCFIDTDLRSTSQNQSSETFSLTTCPPDGRCRPRLDLPTTPRSDLTAWARETQKDQNHQHSYQ